MTPVEQVLGEFRLPFDLHPYQTETVNDLAPYTRAGFYHEAGAGKTATSTVWMLYQQRTRRIQQWVLVMPPILLGQWHAWLRSVKRRSSGEPLRSVIYRGSPKLRAKIHFDHFDFILMSYGIFRNDYDRITEHFAHIPCGILCDEGHAVKNFRSLNHRAVRGMMDEVRANGQRSLAILTGTPLTTPMDGYGYIRLIAPGTYHGPRHFEMLHVQTVDDYNRVIEYANLDILESNMKIQTSRVLRREVNDQLPSVIYTPLVYELDPRHLKLYNRIAEERLVELDNGQEIDALSAQALYSQLQQIIINWGEFADDPSLKPAALELIEEVLEEIGEEAKLVVVANFQRTNRYLLKALAHHQVEAVYGEITAANKQLAISRFIEDPACRILLVQPQSAGFGVDGLQHVCSEMIFLEAPTTAPPFHQTVARLDRNGQKNPVNCRVAIADKTLQVRMFRKLLTNDATINAVQGGYQDLKDAIFGDG